MSVIRRALRLGYFVIPQRLCQSLTSHVCNSGVFGNNVRRYAASTNDVSPSEKMEQILQKRFPKAKKITVNDLSGGCGSMYEIFVETIEFKGLPLVKQHMLINQTLKDEIKGMHGLTVKTKVADADGS